MSQSVGLPTVPTVRSEEEAWALLEAALAQELPAETPPLINFRGWPKVEVYLPTTPIDASITTSMMGAFLEYQEALNRTYTLLSANSPDLRGLSRDERESLELRFEVRPGSNNYVADAAPVVERLGLELIGKMPPWMIAVTIVSTALIIGGSWAFSKWLAHKTETRKAELDAAGKTEQAQLLTQHMSSIRHMREEDTKRLELMTAAMKQRPVLNDVEAVTEPARQQIVRVVGEEKGGTVQGSSVTPFVAAEITAQRRREAQIVRREGVYRVSKVDTMAADGFRVTLLNEATGESIVAALQDALISEEHRKIIQEAEWSKAPVRVSLDARQLGQRLMDAVVRDVARLPGRHMPTDVAG